jgi:hypothetical protein
MKNQRVLFWVMAFTVILPGHFCGFFSGCFFGQFSGQFAGTFHRNSTADVSKYHGGAFAAAVAGDPDSPPQFLEKIMSEAMGDVNFNKSYYKSGCYVRAHWIAELIHKAGFEPLKIFVQTESWKIKMKVKTSSGAIGNWVYHIVAAYKDSKSEVWVLDPALRDSVLRFEDWLAFIRGQNPGLSLHLEFKGPEQYHVDTKENSNFMRLGSPYSKAAMDFIRDEMQQLFLWEAFDKGS